MSKPEKINVLRVQVDDAGHVWFGDDQALAVDSGLTVPDFLVPDESGVDLRHVRLVRVLGTRRNAALICGMQDLRTHNTVHNEIQLGSPSLCQTQAVLNNPERVLQYLKQPDTPSALSRQWHRCERIDYVSYALSMLLDGDLQSPQIQGYSLLHPAWAAVTFVSHVDLTAARQVLVDILDPRWFVPYWRPHRLNRLHTYLGLIPQNIASLLGKGPPGRNCERAARVLKMWYNPRSLACPQHFATGAFLWRIKGQHPDPVAGCLRACKKLVAFLSLVWLNAARKPHFESGFVPDLFFHRQTEVEAFVEHWKQARRL